MKSLGRRTFLKKSSQAGAAAFIGSWSLPEHLNVKAGNDGRLIQKTKNPICRVKKEITVACPGFRMAPWNHMGYIGKGMRREETFSFEQSSDWHMMHLRRISEDNGHTWSEWIPIPQNDGLVQGQYTLSGGPTQFGCGQYDPVSGLLIKDVFQRIFRGAPRLLFRRYGKATGISGIMDFINYLLIMAEAGEKLISSNMRKVPILTQQTGEKMNGLASIKCIKAISPLS